MITTDRDTLVFPVRIARVVKDGNTLVFPVRTVRFVTDREPMLLPISPVLACSLVLLMLLAPFYTGYSFNPIVTNHALHGGMTTPRRLNVPRGDTFSSRKIMEDLVIERGETVIIEPGCVLSLGPGVNLTVKGTLIARGEPDAPISFVRSDPSGQWGSIIIDSTGFTHLKHVCILGSRRGIVCNNSSPLVENAYIAGSTNAVVMIGSSRALFRNVTIENVTNSIGIRDDDGGARLDERSTSWEITLSGPGSINETRTSERISCGLLDTMLGGDLSPSEREQVRVDLGTELAIPEDMYDELTKRECLRLVVHYSEPPEVPASIDVTVNGIPQEFSLTQGAGVSGTISPGFRSQTSMGDLLRIYGDALLDGDGDLSIIPPLPSDIVPAEHVVELRDGIALGKNVVSVIMNGSALSSVSPSVRVEYAPRSLPLFDNVSICNASGWGIFIENGRPVFMDSRFEGSSRHAVIKGSSRPVFMDSRFRGGGAIKGICSKEGNTLLAVRGCEFSGFEVPAIEVSGGSLVLCSSVIRDIDTGDSGAVLIDGNPELNDEFRIFNDLCPSVLYSVSFENASGWALESRNGAIHVGNTSVSDSGNGLYLGEGTRGSVTGCTINDLSGTGLLLWRCIDGEMMIEGNDIGGCAAGIIVKGCGAVIYDNVVTGCGGGELESEITSGALASTGWGIFVEKGSVLIEGNSLNDNDGSVLFGIGARGTMKSNTISAGEGYGIAILPEKGIVLADNSISIEDGYDLLHYKDADIVISNCTYSGVGYISRGGDDVGGDNGRVLRVTFFIILIIIVGSIWLSYMNRRKR